MNKANIVGIAVFALACVYLPAANAFVIDSSTQVGDTFDVSWELLSGATDASGNLNNTGVDLSGGATFEYLGTSGNQIGFELTLTNTTSTSGGSNVGLTGFGFGTDADFTVASWGDSSGTDTDAFNFSGSNGSGVPTSGPTNRFEAIGSLPGGLPPGESDEFVFKLELPQVVSPNTQPITVSPLEALYVPNVPGNGADGGSTPGEGNQTLRVAVPVPGTLLLIGAVLLMARRRFLISA